MVEKIGVDPKISSSDNSIAPELWPPYDPVDEHEERNVGGEGGDEDGEAWRHSSSHAHQPEQQKCL